MKRIAAIMLLSVFLLCGCGAATEPAATAEPTETVFDDTALLCGVWVNTGQYEAGKDFVETLTIEETGAITVHLDYQGSDYATLTGTWTAERGTLVFVVRQSPESEPATRTYQYQVDGTTLRLQGDGKDVTYDRK